jgi:hypothetical protein
LTAKRRAMLQWLMEVPDRSSHTFDMAFEKARLQLP